MRLIVPYVVIAGVVIRPDVGGFAVGGFKLDLKQAQDEIAALRQEVNAQARASSTSIVALGGDALDAIGKLTPAAIKTARDEATGPAVRWPSPSSGTQSVEDIT